MTTKDQKKELLTTYFSDIAAHKYLATQAFGSRATESAEHDASREYTRLLTEYSEKGGSLLKMAEALGVTYPSLRRRVMTSVIEPLPRSKRSTATPAQYKKAVARIKASKALGVQTYHDTIRSIYEDGIALNRLATELGLKSAYPLYYGLNKSRMRAQNAKGPTL